MTDTQKFNPATLPFKFVSQGTIPCTPRPELLMFMHDLHHKHNHLWFHVASTMYNNTIGNVNVMQDTTVLGTISVRDGYRGKDQKSPKPIYQVSSLRIKGGRRGSDHVKSSIHYKTILKEAVEAVAPYADSELAQNLVTRARRRVNTIVNRAQSHADYARGDAGVMVLEYLDSIEEHGPSPIPNELKDKLGKSWREKVANVRITRSLWEHMSADDGAIIIFSKDNNEFSAVFLKNKDQDGNYSVQRLSSSYDLPPEYQDKFAILKMMEFDQPILGVGVKTNSEDNAVLVYMTSGEIVTSC